jgi:ketosteroid isomerase-like protein
MKTTSILVLILLTSVTSVVAQEGPDHKSIVKTLNDFETAIIENNSELASKLLRNDVVILEGRGRETKDEYLSHHFHTDGRFLSAIERKELSQDVKIEENIAWVSTITTMKGTYSDRDIDLTSLELAVLKKENGKWKIVALHWSFS